MGKVSLSVAHFTSCHFFCVKCSWLKRADTLCSLLGMASTVVHTLVFKMAMISSDSSYKPLHLAKL